jgi:hypothetical protein
VRRTRREEADGVELPEAGEVEVARLDGIALQGAVVIYLPELSPRPKGGVIDEAGLVGQRVALDVPPEAPADQSVTEDLQRRAERECVMGDRIAEACGVVEDARGILDLYAFDG